jgi:hypothetical protein
MSDRLHRREQIRLACVTQGEDAAIDWCVGLLTRKVAADDTWPDERWYLRFSPPGPCGGVRQARPDYYRNGGIGQYVLRSLIAG